MVQEALSTGCGFSGNICERLVAEEVGISLAESPFPEDEMLTLPPRCKDASKLVMLVPVLLG